MDASKRYAEPVTIISFVLLLVAGVGAGLVGYLVGLASLISYPALLAAGLPPVAANVTNTLALVGAGLGTSVRAGRQFAARGLRKTLIEVVIALLGGLLGGWLLVTTGEHSFSSIVPWLVLSAGLLLLVSPRLSKAKAFSDVPRPVYYAALLLICIYGGWLGPSVQRRIPENVLRIAVTVSSIVLSVWLWMHR